MNDQARGSLFADVRRPLEMMAAVLNDEACQDALEALSEIENAIRRAGGWLQFEGNVDAAVDELLDALNEREKPLDELDGPGGFYRMLCLTKDATNGLVRMTDMLPPHGSVRIPVAVWETLGKPERVRVELTARGEPL